MRTVIFSIPLGYYARNLLRSGVFEALAGETDLRLVILTPEGRASSLVREFALDGRVFFEELHPRVTPPPIWERALYKLSTLWRSSPVAYRWVAVIWERVHGLLHPVFYREVFRRYRPDLVVTGSPGYHSDRDIPVIREARLAGVRTLCAVFSWDNLATHGIMPTRPDQLAVWNEMMRQDACEGHHYDPERVEVVGPPHFDVYHRVDVYRPRDEFLKGLGLDPTGSLVTVIGISNNVVDNTYLLHALVDARLRGALEPEVQILYRPHPTDRSPRLAGARQRYEGRGLTFDWTMRYSPALRWDPDWEEMVHLANVLKHSDVVINFASTIAIEAAILDRPVVNIEFSTTEPDLFQRRIIDLAYPRHYRHILARNGVRRVRTVEELIDAIRRYLADPSQEREGRRRIAEDLGYRLDGKSSARLAELISRLASRG